MMGTSDHKDSSHWEKIDAITGIISTIIAVIALYVSLFPQARFGNLPNELLWATAVISVFVALLAFIFGVRKRIIPALSRLWSAIATPLRSSWRYIVSLVWFLLLVVLQWYFTRSFLALVILAGSIIAFIVFFLRSVVPPGPSDTARARKAIYRVVYYDADYPTNWVSHPDHVRDYFVERGFHAKNAPELKKWMVQRIGAGDAHKAVVVFAQDIVPDTVAETMTPACTVRRYLDAGGRIVWQGDIPFYKQGRRGGTHDEWLGYGPGQILEVRQAAWPADSARVELTDVGRKWGIRYPGPPSRPVVPEDVTTVLSQELENGGACCWHKVFNEQYPFGGFIRYWAGPGRIGWHEELNEDLFRLATAFWLLDTDNKQYPN
jgi:hypothetical protein